MKPPGLAERPALKPGCRLSPASNPESLLLIPEGALRLHGPGRRILELCDGQHTLADVIDQLQMEFPSAEANRIAGEVVTYLSRLHEKGAIEFL
ncbi:MAG: pyrroloquinoline quinone biosynthesis peptide chaperone PqqD [Acidobacteriaceae bacterium]|nr:pyrroloquinoline quinone biosynthesis peptide chaperone PqqD [Acidobacteriaceae bacterium]MBV9781289.1 pyrroloquinoline quinone biosynthesis peptide chaperone PqqD [Acidobacteriaceae bacterium]